VTAWAARVAGRLEGIQADGRWRAIRPLDGRLPTAALAGRPVVSFASNDYLGLATHPAVAAAAHAAIERWGTGSGASRLVVGARPVHEELEAELAAWKGTDAALLLPTGFAANLAVLATLADAPDVLVVSDEVNHASIIDGGRLSRGTVAVARHNDVDHVDALLAAHQGPAIVVTDTVFSMDGDLAPVDALAEVCRRHQALLVLDEAHAVLGPSVDLTAPAWGTCRWSGWARCRRPSDRWAGSSPHRGPSSTCSSTSPAPSSSPPPRRRPTRRRGWPRCGSCDRRRGRRWPPACVATSTWWLPATRRPSCRW
jgi:hypothetical protein